jgi:hypothetical protein
MLPGTARPLIALPFLDLPSGSLKLGIQHVHRAPKHVRVTNAWHDVHLSEPLHWRLSGADLRGCIDRVVRHYYGVWPEIGGNRCRPSVGRVQQHGLSHGLQIPDLSFGMSILVVRLDACVRDRLARHLY